MQTKRHSEPNVVARSGSSESNEPRAIANQAPDGPTNWREPDAWLTPGRFAAILGTLIFLTFFDVVTGLQTFCYRDFGIFGYPLAYYQRECFWRGELPLWNPLNNCGIPFLAQWNTLCLYPLSLFYLVFPVSWSLGVFNLGHLFLAGMGMHFLARRWLGNHFAAGVAGIVFAFNGLTWQSLMWPNNIAGLGWMPWVVLFVERAWCEGGKRVAMAAIIGAMQLLTGAPEIIGLTWVVCGCLWLGQFVRGTTPRRPMILRSALTVVLVAGIAAAQLLPFLDLLRHSYRDTSFGDSGWAMPVTGFANFIEPLFHCFEMGHGVFVQYNQYWTSSYYVGVGTVLLAAVALWRVRERRVILLAAIAVMGVVLALGTRGFVYNIVRGLVPQFGMMRFPIKFVVLTVFVLPLLAGYGVRWHQQAEEKGSNRRRTLGTVALILFALLAVIMWVEWRHPMVQDDWAATWHNALWRSAFLALTPGILFALRGATKLKLQVLLRIGFLLVLWLDVFTLAPEVNPTARRSVYEPGLTRAYLHLPPQPHVTEPRVMQTAAATSMIRYAKFPEPGDDYLSRRASLFNNCNLLEDLPAIDGFYSLYLPHLASVLDLIDESDKRKIDLTGLKDFLGIAHVNAVSSDRQRPEWLARTNYLPRVTTGQTPVFVDDGTALAKLARPDFDPRTVVLLPPEAREHVLSGQPGQATIVSLQASAQHLKMAVTAAAPAMVVVAQEFYHPWHAYVDGKRTELFRANYAFQALQVPSGHHEIMLVYEDNFFRLGVAISLGALTICAWLWFRGRAKAVV